MRGSEAGVPYPADMERSSAWDLADLARRYAAGESIRAIAGATGVPSTTVYRRLVAANVRLRPPGRHPGLTGEAGRRRYTAAVARGDLAAPAEPTIPGPRAARQNAPARRPQASGDPDLLLAGLAALAADVRAAREQQPAPELDDYDLAVIAEALQILRGEAAVADTGSTRGVRLGADGQPERF
jgi:hypothetical protein